MSIYKLAVTKISIQ